MKYSTQHLKLLSSEFPPTPRHGRWPVWGMSLVCASAAFGCASLTKMVRTAFVGPEVEFTRTAPAAEDLPNTSTVAVSQLGGKGEDANSIAGYLGTMLSESGRFEVVERARLQSLAEEKGCSAGDVTCIAGVLPASAIIVGDVTQSTYSENTQTERYECTKDKKKTTCTQTTRTGQARVSANLRLVDTTTGKVLYQRQLKEVAKQTTTGYDGNPPDPIDQGSMIESGRELVARAFFEAISPHPKVETVGLEEDGDIPELERGNDLLKAADYTSAVAMFESGVANANANPELDPDEKGKAYYNLGMAQAMAGDWEPAIENLRKATSLDPDDDEWATMLVKVSTWKGEAAAVERQLAFAQQAQQSAPTEVASVDESVVDAAEDAPAADGDAEGVGERTESAAVVPE